MNPFDVHLRLLSTLPVRTHVARAPRRSEERASKPLPPEKLKLMRELDGTMSRRAICELLEVGHVTIWRHLGRAKKPQRISTAPKRRKE